MHRQTRKNLLNIVTGIAVAAAAAVVFMPAAQAAPGTATSNVNVRSGPGTGFGVIDTLRRGEQVDVQRCQGSWCYVQGRGFAGWVSASYLSAGGSPVNPSNPGLSFGFTIGGPGGPNISIGVGGNQPQPRPPRPGPRPPVIQPVYEVCFFDRTNYRGNSFCMEQGETIRDLRDWTDRISSIDNPSRVRVEVCSEVAYRNCRTYTTSAATLGDFNQYVASIRIR